MLVRRFAAELGKGALAGLAGTAVTTASSAVEMRSRGREPSYAPAEALCTALGVETLGEREKQRLTTLVHWGYGSGLGMLRGMIGLTGMRGGRAAALFFALTWGGAQVMLPALRVAPPITQWDGQTITIDVIHHVAHALGTSAAYEVIERT